MNVTIENLKFCYGERSVLNGVDARIEQGKLTCLVGPNGVGKSTVIKCMSRLLKPASGVIRLNDKTLDTFSPNELARKQAYVPQASQIVFPLTVEEFVALGRRPYVRWALGAADHAKISEVLKYLNIAHMRSRYLDELSGGERQRVMLARALAQEPQVLLLDEPISALDVLHQLEVMNLLCAIAHERLCAVVVVMHDLMLVARYADQVLLMKEGRIFAAGTPRETLTVSNIRAVYQVEAQILESAGGMVVIPLEKSQEETSHVLWS